MRIIILTTDTTHHSYYMHQLIKKYKKINFLVISEKNNSKSNKNNKLEFKTSLYEKKKWFNNKEIKLDDIIQNYKCNNINNKIIIKKLISFKPNLIICFGVSRIKKDFLNKINKNIYNLHGGNPEEYRGLDSHLWAIYHNDYDNLKVTLHKLEEKLDTGDIYKINKIKLTKNIKIQQLRSITTNHCISMSKHLIESYIKRKKIKLFRQNKIGRYYSSMPNQIKASVIKKFNKYTSKI